MNDKIPVTFKALGIAMWGEFVKWHTLHNFAIDSIECAKAEGNKLPDGRSSGRFVFRLDNAGDVVELELRLNPSSPQEVRVVEG